MKQTVQKIVLIGLALALIFIMFRCALSMKESGSPYIRFPNKIETFR